MLYISGIDVGSRLTKAVILDENSKIIARSTTPTGAFFAQAAEKTYEKVLSEAELSTKDISYVASTGYGRYQVPFRYIQITEVTCHAKGAMFLFPGTQSVLDIGAQNSRAILVGEQGRVRTFRMNDKCASGAGKFLERVAKSLEVELDDIGQLSLHSTDPQPISSICAVLAESEVINLVSQEKKVEDILCGVHTSLTDRIIALLRQVGVKSEVTLTGGVTKNIGMVNAIEQKLGMKVNISKDSEFAGAIGAAVLGLGRLKKKLNN